jgi:pre-mRNA-splicing factor ATP-dependent RNA helicase DHX15/PRP43
MNKDENINLENKNYWKIGIFDPKGKNKNPFNSQPYSSQYKTLGKFWSNLPAYKMAKEIVETIISNDIVLIKSGTGSGKSVLIPKLCLHANNYNGKIIMTLPKKIITKKAAEFSAKTLDVDLGEQIGYQFRGDSLKSSKTILLYSTDGSVISMLKSDPLLKSIDMLIIDEAHERKVNIDLLLYLLKNAINERKKRNMKQLKLIIMSATINEDIFENYYKDYKFVWMELAGTPNHPIKSIYLESGLDIKSNEYLEKGKELIGQIIVNINKGNKEYIEGDILFFVCTVSECNNLAEELSLIYSDCFVMGLYSGFDTELEKYISSPDKFKELNPKFKRRIFISTNVAESSLTIDGIVYVIDSGLELSVKFNPKSNTNNMTKNFITQAQMIQRKGRAGRTKPGVCFHLYTPIEQSNTLKYPEPEIKCIDLKNTCISMMKICGDLKTYHNKRKKRKNKDEKNKDKNENNSIKTFCEVEKTINMFLEFIEPPEKQFIINGFDFAYKNNLIGKDNKLTLIGQLVLETKLDVMDGLALLWAWNVSLSVFKDVFKIICICSYLKSGINDLFYSDVELAIKNKLLSKLLKKCDNSEHVLLLNLFNYVNDNKDTGMFNAELYDNINNIYSRQINKLEYLYNRYNIKLEEVSIKKDLETNIINSFGFGYKSNRAFKKIKGFMYNDKIVNLSKCVVKFKSNINSIIFYSNLNWSGKLNVMICSPYLL